MEALLNRGAVSISPAELINLPTTGSVMTRQSCPIVPESSYDTERLFKEAQKN